MAERRRDAERKSVGSQGRIKDQRQRDNKFKEISDEEFNNSGETDHAVSGAPPLKTVVTFKQK